MAEADDLVIVREARTRGAVIISKDGDFARGGPVETATRVVWVRVGNTTNERLIGIWEGVWPGVLSALEAGELLVEVGTPPGS